MRTPLTVAGLLCSAALLLAAPAAALKPRPTAKGGTAKGKAAPQVAAKPAPPPAGTVLVGGRDVAVRPEAAADWGEAELGQALGPRDRVRTGKAAAATVDAAGARLWLDPGTQILVLGERPRKGKAGVALLEGALRVSVDTAGPGGKLRMARVQAGDSEVRVRGTARVQAGAAGEFSVAVYEGSVEVAGKGGAARLPAGTGAVLRRGGRPKIGRLIGAPTWTVEGGLYFAVPHKGGSSAELTLPFQPVAGAARYRLEIGRDEALTDRVLVGTIPAESKAATARVSGKGRYFARLQAVDSDQVAGPGPVVAVAVVEVRGERLQSGVAPAAAGKAPAVLLVGSGELAFDLVPPPGRLQVQLDGKPIQSDGHVVPLRVGRGLHRVTVVTEGGQRGELRAEVSRPSYAVEIVQERQGPAGRGYRFEIRAIDAVGQGTQGGEGLQARSGLLDQGSQGQEARVSQGTPVQALALAPKGGGVYAGELEVPVGRVARLVVQDGDGPVAVADLPGPRAE